LFETALAETTIYELDQMAKAGYSEDFCYFWNDMSIQDDSTMMFKTAKKLFDAL